MTTYKSQTAKIIQRSSVEFLDNHESGMLKAIESAKFDELRLRKLGDNDNADFWVKRQTEMQDFLNEFQDFRMLIGR